MESQEDESSRSHFAVSAYSTAAASEHSTFEPEWVEIMKEYFALKKESNYAFKLSCKLSSQLPYTYTYYLYDRAQAQNPERTG